MNQSILMGRLTRDPDIRYSRGENSIAIANFRIAVDRTYRTKDDEDTTDYFSCTAFGRLAEFAEEHLVKGIKVLVTGRLQNDNYKNSDGDRVYGTKLILSQIEFTESKEINESYRSGNYRDDEADRESDRRGSSGERRSGRSSRQSSEQRRSGSKKGGSSREEGRGGNSRSDSGRRSRGREDRNPDDEFMDTESADDYAFD